MIKRYYVSSMVLSAHGCCILQRVLETVQLWSIDLGTSLLSSHELVREDYIILPVKKATSKTPLPVKKAYCKYFFRRISLYAIEDIRRDSVGQPDSIAPKIITPTTLCTLIFHDIPNSASF